MRVPTDSGLLETLQMEWRWLDLIDLEAGPGLYLVFRECLSEPQRTYAFRWSPYYVYGVTDESFALFEARTDGEGGPLRELHDTAFLKYAYASIWKSDEKLRHWQIAASHHVIDVAAAEEPEITFIEGECEWTRA